MNNNIVFKNEIIKYAVFTALICEFASVLFLGFNLYFAYGIILGTAISILNFNILYFTLKRLLTHNKGAVLIFFGYIIRLSFYGLVFYKCIQLGYISAIGAVIGFLTIKISIYYTNTFKRKKNDVSG